MNERAPLTIRANLLKTSREELFNTFKKKGFSVKKTEYSPYGIQFLSHPKVFYCLLSVIFILRMNLKEGYLKCKMKVVN
jgi:16S rRNA C967 or C1407 C5-methylase (RsmB/RsmF family)